MTERKPSPKPRSRLPLMRIALWFLVAAVLALLVLVWFFGRSEMQEVSQAGEPYGTAFTLVDQNDAPVTQAVLRSRPTALFFGFTHCPDVCPTTLFELSAQQKALKAKGEDLAIVFVTVDPERDTPEILKTYVSALSDDITAVTGSPEAVAAMLKGYGAYSRKVPQGDDYTMDHTASVIMLDRQGRFIGTIAYGENPDTARAKLERLARL
ncbi:SCO family protein [Aureimonas sp. ME7]|uniref:SCO family protein n=1 Tax=Aureimonas sp. ME7 TaxID=2744252 RepID=UPI0015F5DD8B|nr:SCO family protein [Aureimonas sp. ME7]